MDLRERPAARLRGAGEDDRSVRVGRVLTARRAVLDFMPEGHFDVAEVEDMTTVEALFGEVGAPRPSTVERDVERDARRVLRSQIAKLELDLAQAFVSSFPRTEIPASVTGRSGPRLLSFAELEHVRDSLSQRLTDARRALADRGEREARNRVLLEKMLLEPGRYKFVRIANADLGDGGCGEWHVRPRLGLIGMLAGWWHVKLSSGCPLAQGPRRRGAAPPPPHRRL